MSPSIKRDQCLTSFAGNVAVQPGKDQIAVLELLSLALAKNKVAELLGHG